MCVRQASPNLASPCSPHVLPARREELQDPACARRVHLVVAATFRDMRYNHPLAGGVQACCRESVALLGQGWQPAQPCAHKM